MAPGPNTFGPPWQASFVHQVRLSVAGAFIHLGTPWPNPTSELGYETHPQARMDAFQSAEDYPSPKRKRQKVLARGFLRLTG